MRVLAIETSVSRASAALLESGVLVREALHPALNQSAEGLLPMIERLLADTGWAGTSIERIGVSIGPGSFTGLRVGIACAQGLALGWGIPVVGVGSLRAMAVAVPNSILQPRCAVLDARRGELFVAAYGASADVPELISPKAIAADALRANIESELGVAPVWIGSGLSLTTIAPGFSAPGADEPRAAAVGLLAEKLDPGQHPASPLYIRDAGATLPNLGASTAR